MKSRVGQQFPKSNSNRKIKSTFDYDYFHHHHEKYFYSPQHLARNFLSWWKPIHPIFFSFSSLRLKLVKIVGNRCTVVNPTNYASRNTNETRFVTLMCVCWLAVGWDCSPGETLFLYSSAVGDLQQGYEGVSWNYTNIEEKLRFMFSGVVEVWFHWLHTYLMPSL